MQLLTQFLCGGSPNNLARILGADKANNQIEGQKYSLPCDKILCDSPTSKRKKRQNKCGSLPYFEKCIINEEKHVHVNSSSCDDIERIRWVAGDFFMVRTFRQPTEGSGE